MMENDLRDPFNFNGAESPRFPDGDSSNSTGSALINPFDHFELDLDIGDYEGFDTETAELRRSNRIESPEADQQQCGRNEPSEESRNQQAVETVIADLLNWSLNMGADSVVGLNGDDGRAESVHELDDAIHSPEHREQEWTQGDSILGDVRFYRQTRDNETPSWRFLHTHQYGSDGETVEDESQSESDVGNTTLAGEQSPIDLVPLPLEGRFEDIVHSSDRYPNREDLSQNFLPSNGEEPMMCLVIRRLPLLPRPTRSGLHPRNSLQNL